MLYSVEHITQYKYHEQVSLCHNIATLSPRNTEEQICKSFTLIISPLPDILEEYEDFYGNKLYYFVIEQEHESLTVTVKSQIEKIKPIATSSYPTQSWETVRDLIRNSLGEFSGERQFIHATEITAPTPEIKRYAELSFTKGRSVFEASFDLIKRIYKDFKFFSGFTTTSTPVSVVMKERKGVCQDFAHLAIACIQAMGLPARYVSGYIETIAPEGKEKLAGVDASHAWLSVYIPEAGWVDFDPTNNKIPDDQYITIGWGRNYFDIVPLKGVIMSSNAHDLKVSVDVKRLGE